MQRLAVFLATVALTGSFAQAQDASPARDVQQVLTSAAADGRFTFILFYRDNGPATQAMLATLQQALTDRDDEATLTYVDVNKRGQKPVIDRFGVGRAPMPLTVAVAPNGAVTGVFARSLTEARVADAFATPNMARCMKSMQEGRLVFVCIGLDDGADVPAGVRDFRTDPEFDGRSDVVAFSAYDPAEKDFLDQLKVDPAALRSPVTAFLAPPAVLVGKFGPAATKNEMAAALHAAGKCCDDPNCKHNHGGQQAKPATSARRNSR